MAGGFQVPAWVEKNRARFLSAPGACGDCPTKPLISSASVFRSLYGSEALARSGAGNIVRSAGYSMLTTKPRLNPPPADETPGAAYFRDVRNHPDVLTTILDAARLKAGYNPHSNGIDNPAAASKQQEAFLRFLAEVDEYYAYVTLVRMNTERIENTRHDCARLLTAVSKVVQGALGDAGTGLSKGIQDTIKAVAEFVTASTSSNSVYNVGYQNVNVPAPVGAPKSDSDPTSALCFSIVGMTKEVNKTTTDTTEYFYITAATFRLKSSVIIAYADHLAGNTITPAETFAAAMNYK